MGGAIAGFVAKVRTIVLCFSVIFAGGVASSTHAQDFRFSNFSLDGGAQVELPAILGFAGLNAGQGYSAGELNAALQRLQGTGLFDTVEFIPRGRTG